MSFASIKLIPQGSLVSFQSKRASDTTVWKGTLESIGTYKSIRSINNPESYNEAVRQTDNSVPSDLNLLTFFQLTVDNGAEQPTTMIFADQWIQPGSLNKISLGVKFTVVVDDPNNNPNAIVSLLASAGYASRIVS